MRNNSTRLSLSTALVLLLLWTATPVIAAPPPGTQKQETDSLVYAVQPGDTLVGIALRYNLTLAEIALANNLQNPNLILPGQQLILPGIPPLESTTPSPDPTTLATDQFHTVQPGETLFIIANQHDVTIGSIVLANNILDPNIVQVGQTLKIPTGPPPTPEPLPAPSIQSSMRLVNNIVAIVIPETGLFDEPTRPDM